MNAFALVVFLVACAKASASDRYELVQIEVDDHETYEHLTHLLTDGVRQLAALEAPKLTYTSLVSFNL